MTYIVNPGDEITGDRTSPAQQSKHVVHEGPLGTNLKLEPS